MCYTCSCSDYSKLQVNHIYGRDWPIRATSMDGRVSAYEREAAEGLINVLCIKCNAALGTPNVDFLELEYSGYGVKDDPF